MQREVTQASVSVRRTGAMIGSDQQARSLPGAQTGQCSLVHACSGCSLSSSEEQKEDMRGIPSLFPPSALVSCSQTGAGLAPRVGRSWGQTSGQLVLGQRPSLQLSVPGKAVSPTRVTQMTCSSVGTGSSPHHNRLDVQGCSLHAFLSQSAEVHHRMLGGPCFLCGLICM